MMTRCQKMSALAYNVVRLREDGPLFVDNKNQQNDTHTLRMHLNTRSAW